MTATSTISAEELDRRFDEGEDLDEFFDMDNPTVRRAERRVNLNMPAWLVDAIDVKAKRLGANRQSYINMTLADSVTE